MYGGSYNMAPIPEADRTIKTQSSYSTMVRSNELPASQATLHVGKRLTLNQLVADPDAATWTLQTESRILNKLKDVGPNGVPCGDLRQTLLHGVVARMATGDFHGGELAFLVSGVPPAKLTAAAQPMSGSIYPGISISEQKVFTRPATQINTARLSLMNLSAQAVEEDFIIHRTPAGPSHHVVKGTPSALAVVDKDHIEAAYRQQLADWVSSGNPAANFQPEFPYQDFGSDSLYLMPAYFDVCKEMCLKNAAEQQKSASEFYTNLANIEVKFFPPGQSWEELAKSLCEGKAKPIAKEIMERQFYVALDLEPTYTICNGKVWEASVQSLTKTSNPALASQ